MKLEQIGFYTLSEARCAGASATSPLSRCEIVLTAQCNFKCPYCRHIGGRDMKPDQVANILRAWAVQGLKNVRFSGGEPTLWPGIFYVVRLARELGMERIAISTNGSADRVVYQALLNAGVNDFSVSLDACCASDGDTMAGGIKGAWEIVVDNIRWLSTQTYTTVGVVLTPANAATVNGIIRFADSLGVSDIRVIPAAQYGEVLPAIEIDADLLAKYPILLYRWQNLRDGKPVRGLSACDSSRCGLVLDDMAVNHNHHFPCIIYMRERGKPIGKVGPDMRAERDRWYKEHDTKLDPICSKNCLDVCVQYNNTFEETHRL
jgi:pyruvate-formate lyase-activating enzyme